MSASLISKLSKVFLHVSHGFHKTRVKITGKKLNYLPCAVLRRYSSPARNTIIISPKSNSKSQVGAMSALSPMDPSSYSRPEIAKIKHISLVLGVDFENKILHGLAELNFDVLKPTDELILDVSKLKIESIQSADGTPLNYQISEHIPNYGSKLTVTVPQCLISCDKCNLKKEAFKDIKVQVNFPCAQRSENPQTIVNTVNMSEFFLYKPIEYLNQPDVMESINSVSSYNSNNTDDSCKCCQCNQNEIVTKIVYEGDRLKINVKYTTSPTASALQWLEPNQTSGKEHPYMFSQCQPIHARSIVPCQDTPAVKFTYEAAVEAPPQFTVLMSALRQECAANRTTFRQPVPVPAYLLAIAVGAMEHRRLGPRLDIVIPEETSVSSGGSDITLKLPPKNITEATTEFAVNRLEESDDYQTFRSLVWTEKAEIERSAWEFAETEKYLQAAEALCGPYQWTQYDLVVLPPSFPYGGMENPCLTFVTPTLLAGDRSQADVIVHEIMHSWTGNLVTNRNFEHFWLNEGFTVFLERKVAASLVADAEEAKRSRDFESLQGLLDLREAVMQELGETNPLTKLVVDLKGVHPDDAFSTVPYEKGSLFLRYLENLVGGAAKFDDFMRSYLNTFQRQSLDTEQFKAYFLQYFEGAECPCPLDSVDWDAWLHTSGMPPVIPHYDTSMTKAINALLTKITKKNATFCYSDVKEFTPHQVINLLQQLLESPALDLENLRTLGNEYKIAESKNSEIKYRWLRLCIRSKDDTVLSDVYEFINQQGRMKYVRPIYRDLYAWEDVRQQTIANFLENEPYMMHVSAYTIRKDLHLDG